MWILIYAIRFVRIHSFDIYVSIVNVANTRREWVSYWTTCPRFECIVSLNGNNSLISCRAYKSTNKLVCRSTQSNEYISLPESHMRMNNSQPDISAICKVAAYEWGKNLKCQLWQRKNSAKKMGKIS